MRKIVISVSGLGYVGLQVSIAFSKKFKTIGYDIDKNRIKQLQNFYDITNEVSVKKLKKTKINYTSDISNLKNANFHIIAVPTPINKNKKPDLKVIKKATINLAKIIKKNDIIVYESTVYPGLTEEICIPLIEKYSGLLNKIDFHIGYSPERINPGDKKNNFEKINKIVSAQSTKYLKIIKNTYASVTNGKIYSTKDIKTAEAAKVIENTQRDLNVALINEFSKIFNKMNIDTYEVLKAASTKWNFLNFKPGLVGGHCIGVDPYYLTYKAKKTGYNPRLILSGREINDSMGVYIAKKALQYFPKNKKLKINILGITFKENCADVRNSKVFDLIEYLKNKNHIIKIFDPYVKKLSIKNKSYKIEKIKDIKKSHIIFICVAHNEFLILDNIKFFDKNLFKNGLLFDVKSIIKNSKSNKNYIYKTL
tara:strand:+ start:8859 stop:10127 length:1269 start_codon:yes stop_codon:yes gene_type:complete